MNDVSIRGIGTGTMETLDEIGIRNGTDKCSLQNNFLSLYGAFFEEMRDEPVCVLEIGVLNGASARTWRDYFSRGRIIGVDVNPEAKAHEGERITIEIADQSDAAALGRLAEQGPFNIVIDDGSHVWGHQILTFQTLASALAPGGYYVIEDLDTSYGRYVQDYRGSGGLTAAQYLQRLSDWVIGCRVLNLAEQPDPAIQRIWPMIEWVAFGRGTALIKRRRHFDRIAEALRSENAAVS
jgi:hypothetical protein